MKLGRIDGVLASLPSALRSTLTKAFEYTTRELKFGAPVDFGRAENFGSAFLRAVTPGTANQEFTLEHSMGVVPHLALPVLNLSETGAKVVNLTVTRPADSRFLYLSSPQTSAVVWLLVEG